MLVKGPEVVKEASVVCGSFSMPKLFFITVTFNTAPRLNAEIIKVTFSKRLLVNNLSDSTVTASFSNLLRERIVHRGCKQMT